MQSNEPDPRTRIAELQRLVYASDATVDAAALERARVELAALQHVAVVEQPGPIERDPVEPGNVDTGITPAPLRPLPQAPDARAPHPRFTTRTRNTLAVVAAVLLVAVGWSLGTVGLAHSLPAAFGFSDPLTATPPARAAPVSSGAAAAPSGASDHATTPAGESSSYGIASDSSASPAPNFPPGIGGFSYAVVFDRAQAAADLPPTGVPRLDSATFRLLGRGQYSEGAAYAARDAAGQICLVVFVGSSHHASACASFATVANNGIQVSISTMSVLDPATPEMTVPGVDLLVTWQPDGAVSLGAVTFDSSQRIGPYAVG